MSKTIALNRFDGGWAASRYERGVGRANAVKGFDILTYPNQLFPTRTGTTDTASTGIGNIIIASDGAFYGLGQDSGAPTTATKVYKKAFFGNDWSALSNGGSGSASKNFDLFVEYKSNGTRELFCASPQTVTANNNIAIIDKENAVAIDTHTLANFTSVSQGIVHPEDDILYIPWTTSSGTFIAKNNAGSWTDAALTLPSNLVVSSIAPYGKYLAIACVPRIAYDLSTTGKTLITLANAGAFTSLVFLWDRNTSLTTLTEQIDWGTGILQNLNVLDGYLVGVSVLSGITPNIRDSNGVMIKAYGGSGQPQLIGIVNSDNDVGASPTAKINPNVNFVYRNRLFFSVNVTGASNYYGLWSIGKSSLSGRYAISIERGVTSGDTETGVLAAVGSGDIFVTTYTANGTMGVSATTSTLATDFAATSYYETVVNPEMPEVDYMLPKQLMSIGVTFKRLVSPGQIVLKYKVDGGSWTTVATYTTSLVGGNDTLTRFERLKDASGNEFTSGGEYQFRVESTAGAIITGIIYKYRNITTSLV